MKEMNNLLKARSHIAFAIGLIGAALIAIGSENAATSTVKRSGVSISKTMNDGLQLSSQGNLTDRDMMNAKIAWAYFVSNTQPTTGLVNSVDNYPSTTIWDQSSYLLGLISANRLGIIDRTEFDRRMNRALRSLARLPLFEDKLPNKAYDTRNLMMTDYGNNPIERGIGWSALDIARMTVPLNVILYDYPQHSNLVAGILSQWNFGAMLSDGQMLGARVNEISNETELVQEGRLGYEEYAARGIGLLGLDALKAGLYDDHLKFVSVSGQEIAVDSRSHIEYDAHNYVVSEPYILTAIEFGFDTDSLELAQRVYLAQKGRFDQSGILTAVSEDNIDQEPYFLYNTVYANGQAWNTLAEDGSSHADKRTLSTKAAFGWDAIFGTEYTDQLIEYVLQTATKDRGFSSGVYEIDGRVNAIATANTNAIILETLQYKANGPLISQRFKNKVSHD